MKNIHRIVQQHLLDGNLVASGVDDEEVAVDGDEENGEGGEEDAGGLDRTNQLAQNLLKKQNITFWVLLGCFSTCHVLAEGPIVGEDVDEGEGHGEGAEEDVRHRQGCNEYVSRCQHHLNRLVSTNFTNYFW